MLDTLLEARASHGPGLSVTQSSAKLTNLTNTAHHNPQTHQELQNQLNLVLNKNNIKCTQPFLLYSYH